MLHSTVHKKHRSKKELLRLRELVQQQALWDRYEVISFSLASQRGYVIAHNESDPTLLHIAPHNELLICLDREHADRLAEANTGIVVDIALAEILALAQEDGEAVAFLTSDGKVAHVKAAWATVSDTPPPDDLPY